MAIVVQEFEIDERIGCIQTDNASNNGTMVKELDELLPQGLPPKSRLFCAGHIINLIAKAILFPQSSGFEKKLSQLGDSARFQLWREERGLIGKIHNIVKYIMRSEQRRLELANIHLKNHNADSSDIEFLDDAMHEEDIVIEEGTNLVKDGGIRWNSTYYMLKRFKMLRNSITLFLTWHKPSRDEKAFNSDLDTLTLSEWDSLDQWLHLLKPLETATRRLEGNGNNTDASSFGALWEVIPNLQHLYLHLKQVQNNIAKEPDSAFKLGVECGIEKLEAYYHKLIFDSDAYILSVCLHPSLRPMWFDRYWSDSPTWIKRAKDVWTAFCQSLPLPPLSDTDSIEEPAYKRRRINESNLDSDEEDKQLYTSLYMTDRRQLGQEDDPERAGVRINREGRDWKKFKVLETGRIEDPLVWWINEQKMHPYRFPGLSVAALNYFCAPAMSAECERVFSRTKRTITEERARLKADTIEATECQKDWLRKRLVTTPSI
jgi:hypothetical protein